MALFSYNQDNSIQTVAEGVKEMAWEDKQKAYPSSPEDATSLSLFSGDQILFKAIAFHLDSRGPDSDLLFFPARVILFHSACFDNDFLPLLPPAAFPYSEMPPEQPTMTSSAAPHYRKEEQSHHERISIHVTYGWSTSSTHVARRKWPSNQIPSFMLKIDFQQVDILF